MSATENSFENLTSETFFGNDATSSSSVSIVDGGAIMDMDKCAGAPTVEQQQFYRDFSWWVEGVLQITVGGLGFMANTVAVPILVSKEMGSVFYHLLACMAVFDNVFIACSVMEGIRKHIVTSTIQEYLFGYFLYQFHNMVMCCCIYMTVILSLERYKAIGRPVEYHNEIAGVSPWRRAMTYVVPVVVFSVVFNLPKFFEVTFEGSNLAPTKLKLDNDYVLWYSNVARQAVTGFIPFVLLSTFNYLIYCTIKKRQSQHQSVTTTISAQKSEDTKQSIMLFVIVALFFLCNILKVVLNLYGLLNLEAMRQGRRNRCRNNGASHLLLIGTSISHLLLTINSSANFLIYCLMCPMFKEILVRGVTRWWKASLATVRPGAITSREQTEAIGAETPPEGAMETTSQNLHVTNSGVGSAVSSSSAPLLPRGSFASFVMSEVVEDRGHQNAEATAPGRTASIPFNACS